jgi:hypothetical protein
VNATVVRGVGTPAESRATLPYTLSAQMAVVSGLLTTSTP